MSFYTYNHRYDKSGVRCVKCGLLLSEFYSFKERIYCGDYLKNKKMIKESIEMLEKGRRSGVD